MSATIQKATSKSSGKKGLEAYIKVMEPAIKAALPSVMTAERFSRITLSAISSNPKLAECSPQSFLGSMMTAAQLGVEPNTPLGQAYLIPYRNHGNMECQFQLGYKGLIDLAYRSGEVSTIQAHEVHENDVFEYELGLDPKLRHVPATKDRGAVIAYYAVFRTKTSGYGFEVMSREDIEAHAKKYSQSYGKGYSSPWATNFDEMAKKTVLKKALKYAPLASDFIKAAAADGTVRTNISDDFVTDISSAEEEPVIPVDPNTGEILDNNNNEEVVN